MLAGVWLLAGNRDLNKLRFTAELDEDSGYDVLPLYTMGHLNYT